MPASPHVRTPSPRTPATNGDTRPARTGGGRPGRPWSQATPGVGFWFASVSFAVLMAFGTAPTPLWPLYAARDGFGATTITVAYAILVIGAASSFMTLGHLSDRFGRRRIVVPALLVAIAAALLLASWPTLPGLLIGRALNGVGIGLMASTATTYLHDLYDQEHPDRRGSALPGIVATAANLGGLALGPLVAGFVAEWAPSPLTTTQAGFATAMALCLVLSLCTPETVDLRQRTDSAPNRFQLRQGGRPVFASAAGLGFFSFAILGLVSSLGAVMLQTKLGIDSRLIAGVAPFLMFASSALGQLLLGRLSAARLLTLGAVVFPVGLVLVTLSLYDPALWLYLVAVAVVGCGAGVLFKGALGQAVAAAVPESRAGVLAAFFGIAYVGMGVPSILFSVAIKHLSIGTSMVGFAAVLTVGAVLAAVAGARSNS